MEDITHHLESLEADPIELKRGPTPIKKRSPKKQGTANKPDKRTIRSKKPDHTVLKPIGPK